MNPRPAGPRQVLRTFLTSSSASPGPVTLAKKTFAVEPSRLVARVPSRLERLQVQMLVGEASGSRRTCLVYVRYSAVLLAGATF